MFEILEIVGRLFLGFLRLGECIDFMLHVLMGVRWWVSPSYRREVKRYDSLSRSGVYLGAFLFFPLLLIVLVILVFV